MLQNSIAYVTLFRLIRMSECLREEILGRVPVLKNSRHAREGGNPDLVGDGRTDGWGWRL